MNAHIKAIETSQYTKFRCFVICTVSVNDLKNISTFLLFVFVKFLIEDDIKIDKNRKKGRSRGKSKGVVHSLTRSCLRQPASPKSHDISVVVGKTPTAIRHEQFSRLVEIMRVDSSIRASEVILSSSSEERKALLQRLYCSDDVKSPSQLDKDLVEGDHSSPVHTCQDKPRCDNIHLQTWADGCRDGPASCGRKVTCVPKAAEVYANWQQVSVKAGGFKGTGPKPEKKDSNEWRMAMPSSSSTAAIDIDEFLFG